MAFSKVLALLHISFRPIYGSSATCFYFEFEHKQTKMEGAQSGTYLRLTRASSGPRMRVAKTYRDETKQK